MKRIAFALLGLVAALPGAAESQVGRGGGRVYHPPPPPPPPPPVRTDNQLKGSLDTLPPVVTTQNVAVADVPATPDGGGGGATPEPVVVPPPEPPPEPPPSDGECDDGDLNAMSNPGDCEISEVPPPVSEQSGSGFSWWYVVIGLAAAFLLRGLYRMVRRR